MKKYLYPLAVGAVFLAACGGAAHKHPEDQAQAAKTEESAGHDHNSGGTHTHADGTACSGSHAAGSVQTDASHDHESEGAEHDHGHGNEGTAGVIIFPPEQASMIDFEVRTIMPSDFTEVIRTSGQILPAQGDEISVAAPVSGVVSFADTRLSDGSAVSVYQRLMYISSKNLASGDVFAWTSAAYNKARADFERAEKLLESRIISQREFDEIRLAYQQAKIEYDAIASSSSERGAAIMSPVSGYVSGLSVGEGDYVEMGQSLITIAQNRRMILRADVSQRYSGRLANIGGANFTVVQNNATYKLEELGGRLVSTGRNLRAGTTLVPVTFEFNGNGEVLPGAFVEVYLLGRPVSNVISVPVTALTEQQGVFYVYVQLDEECYERREVKVGAGDGERVRILSGLKAGEKVVTRGAINVKMAAASGEIPHGHQH